MSDAAATPRPRDPATEIAPTSDSYAQLANRLANRHRHLRKMGKRLDTTCWRLYEKDIPDQPLIVDWFDGAAVVWALDRTRNDDDVQERAWLAAVLEAVRTGLQLGPDAVHLKRRRRQKDRQEGDGQYHRLEQRSVIRTVREAGLSFIVNLSDYLDTGLFLDHRPLRARVRAEAAGKRVLNLFAYTGSFTVYARAGGARASTTVDLSTTYLEWAARNMLANELDPGDPAHELVKTDVLRWVEQALTERARWEVIICDPPTFSNSNAMTSDWSVDRDHPGLIARLLRLLVPGGTLWFSTNSRGFRLAEACGPAEDLTEWSIPEDFRNRAIHRLYRFT